MLKQFCRQTDERGSCSLFCSRYGSSGQGYSSDNEIQVSLHTTLLRAMACCMFYDDENTTFKIVVLLWLTPYVGSMNRSGVRTNWASRGRREESGADPTNDVGNLQSLYDLLSILLDLLSLHQTEFHHRHCHTSCHIPQNSVCAVSYAEVTSPKGFHEFEICDMVGTSRGMVDMPPR